MHHKLLLKEGKCLKSHKEGLLASQSRGLYCIWVLTFPLQVCDLGSVQNIPTPVFLHMCKECRRDDVQTSFHLYVHLSHQCRLSSSASLKLGGAARDGLSPLRWIDAQTSLCSLESCARLPLFITRSGRRFDLLRLPQRLPTSQEVATRLTDGNRWFPGTLAMSDYASLEILL